MDKVLVSKIKCFGNLKEEIKNAVGVLGGFSKFINKGDVVFLKPNFNTADPYPASTDLPFLKAAAELLYEAGAKNHLNMPVRDLPQIKRAVELKLGRQMKIIIQS